MYCEENKTNNFRKVLPYTYVYVYEDKQLIIIYHSYYLLRKYFRTTYLAWYLASYEGTFVAS